LGSVQTKNYQEKFNSFISDDLSVPRALALVWDVLDSDLPREEKVGLIAEFDRVLGLDLMKSGKALKIPKKVRQIAEKREELRQQKKWQEADRLRLKMESLGFAVEDKDTGYQIKPLD